MEEINSNPTRHCTHHCPHISRGHHLSSWAQKILGVWGGHGLQPLMDSFEQWFGVPPALSALVAIAEFTGSLALILGLGARFMAGSIMMVMLGAMYLVVGNHFFMNWYNQPQYGEGFEFHLLALGLGLIVIIKGAGKYSIDAWLQTKWFESKAIST